MKPNDFRRLSVLYLYNELPESERKNFENHLKSCSGCREEIDRMKQAAGSVEIIPDAEPSPCIKNEVLTYAGEYRKRGKSLLQKIICGLSGLKVYLRYAVAIIAILLGVIMFMNHFSPPKKTILDEAETSQISGYNEYSGKLDQKIKSLKNKIRAFQYPDVDFNDAIKFYNSNDNMSLGLAYSPFSDSRPYRKLDTIAGNAKELSMKLVKF